MRSAEGNDEERLPVLDRCAAGDEHLADLTVGRRADLRDLAERLDAAEHVASRDRVARRPLAGGVEDADGRRVYALRLLDRRQSIGLIGPGHARDRTALRPA